MKMGNQGGKLKHEYYQRDNREEHVGTVIERTYLIKPCYKVI